jgi:CheY-like chemotaxis protein
MTTGPSGPAMMSGPATSDEPAPASPPSLHGSQILVIDDDADAREAIAEALRESGATVTSSASVRDALQDMATQRFDIVVSDIAMPGADGYAFIQAVRTLPRDRQPRAGTLALTA